MITLLASLVLIATQPELANEARSEPGSDARSAPLETVFPFWTDYLALPPDERDGFAVRYVFDAPLRGDGQAFSFWIETGPGQFQALDATGPITPPAGADFEDGQLFTDAPRGAVSVQMQLIVQPTGQTSYTLEELEASIAQARNAMRGAMGIRALFMPRLDTVRFVFDGSAPEADFMDVDGNATPINAVFSESVLVTPSDRETGDAVSVEFGTAPLYAVLETRR